MGPHDLTPAQLVADSQLKTPREMHGYALDFEDTFEAPTLNAGHWLPHYLPHWGGRLRSAARYALSDQGLQLRIDHDQEPWNPEIDGALRVSGLQTGCFAGPLGSHVGQHRFHPDLRVKEEQPAARLYTPCFGYFETRVKAVPIPGYMVALWMIGVEEQPQESGEICVFEVFGQDVTSKTMQVRYGVHPFGDPTLREEFYTDTFAMEATLFHTYAVEWTHDRLAFYVDHVHVRTIHQSPQYAMQFMLTLYELPQQLTQEAGHAPWPRAAYVRYVRGYARIEEDSKEGTQEPATATGSGGGA